jgi:regulator of cell morphogenesis and NO signaling
MEITPCSKVGELAATVPATMRVFDLAGIDYCCGGHRTLREACERAGAATDALLAALLEAAAAPPSPERDFLIEPLSSLVTHLIVVHHTFTREELERASKLMAKVAQVHGGRHGEVLEMRGVLQGLRDELEPHLMKEERVLFPYICALEHARTCGEPVRAGPFGPVSNPVRMMNQEHESAGAALEALRALSSGYAVPHDGCASYRSLFDSLQSLERDLHRHIHLESNILFPRAIALEATR